MAQFCFGCMRQKLNRPVCELCGFDERTENQSHQLPIGTILQNQYLVGRVLGQGGFGITYIGWDQHLSIPVAIKEYYPGGVVQRNTRWSTDVMCTNGEAPELFEKHKTRFLKEARTLAQLSGIPEIVQIKSFFPENGTAYIVMEYVEGITLKDHLKRLGRPMTETEALAIMEPVLKALQKVHDQGLIHRDISPDNIMLPKTGGIRLIDFGTVRYMDDSGKSKSTEAVLKPGFAPMEQYNSRGNLGTWTDVYAICATYHYLLTGKVPADVHDRMDEGESLTILRARSGISKKLIATLEKGMKLRATERIQTVKELHQLLYPARKNSPAKNQPGEKKVSPQKKEGTGKKGTVAIACAMAAVAIGAAMMLQIPRQQAALSTPETTAAPAQTTAETAAPTVLETTEPITAESMAYAEAEQLLADGETTKAAIAFGKLGDYSDARQRSFALWREVAPPQVISSDGGISAAAVRTDGTVLLAGYSDYRQIECQEWTDIVSVSTTLGHTAGLKKDGTVVSVGTNIYNQCDTSSWSDIVAIDADDNFTVGLKADGTVLYTGPYEKETYYDWPTLIEELSSWKDIAVINILGGSVIGIRIDGTVVSVKFDYYGIDGKIVKDWSDIISISGSRNLLVGLKSDGTVIATNDDIQSDVLYWSDIVAVAALSNFAIGLKSDGTVVTTGEFRGETLDLSGWTDIAAISADTCTIGVKNDGSVVFFGKLVTAKGAEDRTGLLKNWTNIALPGQMN